MPIALTIVTPEGTRFDGPVERVVVPGTEGDFGVLPGHERFLSPVRIGELEIDAPQPGQQRRWAAVSDGFAEVNGDKVVLMVDSCEFADNIDKARAERARVRAEAEIERMRAAHAEEQSYRMQELALQRALVRIQVAGKQHGI